MRAPNKGNHPCPVLLEDGGDYSSDCSLVLNYADEPVNDGSGFTLETKYALAAVLACPPLSQLYSEGKVKIALMVEQATIRKAFDYTPGFVLSVSPYELKLGANLEITPLVIATQNFELKYDSKYMDEMYGLFSSKTFPVEQGQILGYGKTLEIKTNPYRGLSAIFSLRAMKEDDPNHPFILELESNKIIIETNKAITESITLLQSTKTNLGGLINSTIAYPAMQIILETMIKSPDEYKDLSWFVAIKNKLAEIRQKKGEEPFSFEPNEFQESQSYHLCDFVWDLTSELLCDSKGQLMVLGFEKASEYSGAK